MTDKKQDKVKPWFDKTKTLEERKMLFVKQTNKMMNPFTNFNPDTFEPNEGVPELELVNRKRKIPNQQLPTFGLKPKEIREGQMIGMYESKQDIYLILAHRNNELQAEVDELRAMIIELQNNLNN